MYQGKVDLFLNFFLRPGTVQERRRDVQKMTHHYNNAPKVRKPSAAGARNKVPQAWALSDAVTSVPGDNKGEAVNKEDVGLSGFFKVKS